MTLGKRGRPTLKSTPGVTFDIGSSDAAAPTPPAGMNGGEFNGYGHMLSPRYWRKNFSGGGDHVETADFLRSCRLCHRLLAPGRDIYMYRGDTAFCSLECREQQMKQDERKERHAAAAVVAKNG